MRCRIEGCDRKYAAKGYCHLHYNRWKRHGDPERVTRYVPKTKTLTERLGALVDRSAGPEGCWPYEGALGAGGYGRIMFNNEIKGVHVWAYEHEHGPVPEGMFVLHSCDNRKCANPAHLRVGTHQDNMDDKVERGRCWRGLGERNAASRLTGADVAEIRRLYASGAPRKDLAAQYGTSRSNIDLIVTGKRWAHLTDGTVAV